MFNALFNLPVLDKCINGSHDQTSSKINCFFPPSLSQSPDQNFHRQNVQINSEKLEYKSAGSKKKSSQTF
jgi:hypothetical protein